MIDGGSIAEASRSVLTRGEERKTHNQQANCKGTHRKKKNKPTGRGRVTFQKRKEKEGKEKVFNKKGEKKTPLPRPSSH